MDDEREKPEEREIKIPVFSVLKKGIVLKNIILNSPPPELIPSTKSHENGDVSNLELEPVIFGRHPDCHIVLDHPSISRFHLEARAIPLLRKLSVTDRSSVHGTWVSGTKIAPNVPIELVEGDMVRLGASTREYRLEWVALSSAFEMENPLSPLLEEKEETNQEDKPGQLITDLNELWDTEIPSAPPMPDYMNPSPSDVPYSLPAEGEEQIPERKGSLENSSSFFTASPLQESVDSSCPMEQDIGYLERGHPSPVRSEKRASSLLSRRSKSKTVSFLHIHTGRSRENISNMSFNAEVEVGVKKENGALSEKDKQEQTMCRALSDNLGQEEEKEQEETFESDKENLTPKGSIGRKLKSRHPDLRSSSLIVTTNLNMEEDVFHSDIENWKPEVLRDLKLNEPTNENMVKSKRDDEMFGSDLRSSSLIVTTNLNMEEDVFHSDIENWKPEVLRDLKLNEPTNENMVKSERDDEMFGSDKENLTPGISSGQKIKEKSCKMLQRSPFNTITASNMVDADRENRTTEIAREMKSRKPNLQRSPFNTITASNMVDADRENRTTEIAREMKSRKPNFGCHMKIEDEEDEAFPSDKENLTPKGSIGRKLKSRHPDLRSSSLIVTTNLEMEEDVFHSDIENWKPEVLRDLKLNEPTNENMVKSERDDEMFGSDEENLTPGISSGQKTKEKSCKMLQRSPFNTITASNMVDADRENRTTEIAREMKSRKPNFGCHMKIEDEEDEAFPSDKENLTPQVSFSLKDEEICSKSSAGIEREMMRKGADRIPLQPLFVNPSSRKSSFANDDQTNVSDHNCTSDNHAQGIGDEMNYCSIQSIDKDREKKKTWNMVVDTSCLLDDESRRSLQLLEGLQGTHLIIPRIVIRELDSLKRRESLFRKPTKASSVLQWIEECMVQTSWWIHVQNSMEIMPVAPTPPASPQSLVGTGSSDFGAGSANSMAFSAWASLMEIVSPTAEDHILDCATLFKKIKDGQLVLLSNSVTLKIKAMAEGLICESPKEFRESLVNPYSKRFLWADSSPRGSTWTCSDEIGLVENYYYQRPVVRKAVKAAEAVKGLKLILLHNSHYRQTNLVK